MSAGSGSTSAALDSIMVADMIQSELSIGIGDYYKGGIVGYIFQPGDADYIPGEIHGYILYFDNTNIEWGCMGLTTNVTDNGIGQGPINTQNLANICSETTYAAKWCNDLVIGPYDDWFLPTFQEASLVDVSFYLNQFSFDKMWLSEEFSISNSYSYSCINCTTDNHAFAMYVNAVGASLTNVTKN